MRKFRKKPKYKLRKIFKLIIFLYIIILIGAYLINNVNEDSNKITREKAYLRAMDMINYKWNYNGQIGNENVKLPFYLKEKGEYIGIPYCYGGQISLDYSNSENVKNFKEAINKNYYPGNINTQNGYIENTAGVDCSGFVGSIYNIKEKISTSTLDKHFEKINIKKIKPMDILNSKGNHVYIFLGETYDKKGIMILEATSNGNNEYFDKTIVNYKTNKEFEKDLKDKNFIPMRYKHIKNDDFKVNFDKYEYNNTKDTAELIKIDEKISASIEYLEDVDYYFFNKNDTKKYNISVEGINSNKEIEVFNENEEKTIINKDGIYEINIKGNIFIKIYLKEKERDKKEYNFKILEK